MPELNVSAREVAHRLNINAARARALARAGQLPARKIANRWFFDENALERRIRSEPKPGRSLEPANAWALLMLASGGSAPWVRSDVRSRLRRRLKEHSLRQALARASKRARTHYFAGADRARKRLLADPRFVRSGISAAAHYGASLRSPRVLEGYLPAGDMNKLAYRYALQAVDERSADLVIHAVSGLWPFGKERVAPRAVVAADLIESMDQRTQRAGEELLNGLGS